MRAADNIHDEARQMADTPLRVSLDRSPRRAFTLMELLLVLALLVAVAAMAMPNLKGPMLNQQLRKSAELVRAEWAKARNRAMRDGVTYAFSFQPGSGLFKVEQWSSGDDYLETSTRSSAGNGLVNATTPPKQKTLPSQIVFQSGQTLDSTRDAATAQQAVLAGNQPNAGWSSPILFYPDGTSSNAEVDVMSNRGTLIRVKLRGLTGIAQSSDVLTAAEVLK